MSSTSHHPSKGSPSPARLRLSPERAIIYLLCFCSGLAGLTYEVIWQRLLALVVGNASTATAAVLAAVMFGVGLGSWLASRRADHIDPLRAYGVVEVLLGLFAVVVPLGARLAAAVVPSWLLGSGLGPGAAVARFLVAAAVVLVPATLMGATLPLLARFVELGFRGRGDPVGPSAAMVYGLNTAGAALGCLLTGYLLLGRLGVFWTGGAAAALDLAVGVAALTLARRSRPAEGPGGARPPSAAPLPPRLALALAATSGACILAAEGLWTRLLRVIVGHDVHAFSSMLASVLVGLALGAGLYAALPRRAKISRALVPALFAVLGLSLILDLAIVGRLYLMRGLDILEVGSSLSITRSHDQGLVLQLLLAMVLVLVTALASGALLPALCAAFRPRDGLAGAGQRVGQVLAANTAGSIAGAVLPVAILIPALGLQRAFLAVAALAAGAAAVSWAVQRGLPAGFKALGPAATIVALALAGLIVPADLPRSILHRKIGPEHLSFQLYQEGATGTVAVVQNRINDERQLFINGVNEVTTRLVHDQSFKLLGHLGLLLHPDPEEVLVICLGAGLSAGAASTHPVESLRVVDLERSVVAAAELFTAENNNVLADPRVTVTVEDGRHHLRTTGGRYDVIVVDSTHPRAVDSWLLYTREFYSLARSRLGREGYLVQWLPLHGLSVDEFRIIVHTFLSEFPQGSLWANVGFEQYGPAAYALLLGPRGGETIDRGLLAERLAIPEVRRDLTPWGLQTVPEVVECFVAGPAALRRWTGHLPINTDDLPWTQFVTPFTDAAPMTAARLLEVREPVSPFLEPRLRLDGSDAELTAELRRRHLAQGFLMAGMLDRALEVCGPTCDKLPDYAMAADQGPDYFVELSRLYEADPDRLLEIASGLAGLGRTDEAVRVLNRAVEIHRADPRLWLNLGLLLAERGDAAEARRAYRSALTMDPEMALGRINLGLLEVRSRRVDQGLVELRDAVELAPDLSEAHAALGFGLFVAQEHDEAQLHLRRALALEPRNHEARLTLGRLWLARERDAAAVATFAVAHRLQPFDGDAAFNLGLAYLRTEQPDRAIPVLEAALRINPDDRQAAAMLQTARRMSALMPQ